MDQHLIKSLRVVRFAVLTAVIVASVLFLTKPLRKPYETFQYGRRLGIRDLVSAAGELPYRAIAPRLSGGFAYRPQRPVLRGAQGPPIDASASKLYASALRLMAPETRRDATN